MNICICTSSFPANRSEVFHHYLEDLLQVLQANGHQVTVLTQDKRAEKENFLPNTRVVWFPWRMVKKDVLAEVSFLDPGNILSLLSLIYNGVRYSNKTASENKADLFICLWIVPSGLYVWLKNIFFSKTPYVLWALGSDVYNNKDNFFARALLRAVIKGSRAVFADGFELCEIVQKISGRDCRFLPTFHKINTAAIQASSAASAKKIPSFLYIGRLSHVKGVDVLIEAFKLLGDMDFRCHILGDGERMSVLADEVRKNNLQDKVLFAGKITDEKEKAGYFDRADCVIIPSRSESIPVVLSEAIQFNRPLITTDAGDMGMLVETYKLGIAVKKEDPAALSEAIKKFIQHPVQIDGQGRTDLLNKLLFEKNAGILLGEIY